MRLSIRASALWARPKSEITPEQYEEFYKHVAHDFEPPLAYVHARVEGKQEYTQLLYIPSRAPFDLYDREPRHGIKLYVRRVFIMDDAKQLLPNYLRFIRGVIDSNDLPLNVSREILQESKDIEAIRAGAVKKVLGLLEDLAQSEQEDQEDEKPNSKPSGRNSVRSSKRVWRKTTPTANVLPSCCALFPPMPTRMSKPYHSTITSRA